MTHEEFAFYVFASLGLIIQFMFMSAIVIGNLIRAGQPEPSAPVDADPSPDDPLPGTETVLTVSGDECLMIYRKSGHTYRYQWDWGHAGHVCEEIQQQACDAELPDFTELDAVNLIALVPYQPLSHQKGL